jgi:hypothetical protein
MKVNCAYGNRELERTSSRAKRRCFCSESHHMFFRYRSGLSDARQIIEGAHEALAFKNWNRGVPNFKLRGDNNPAKSSAVRAKISASKIETNWMRGRTGALHHNYLGGKIWWRGKDWDDIKLVAKTRDGFQCVQCGRTEQEQLQLVGMPLSVDHIIMYRISHDNSLDNLQTLCSSCHGKKIPEEKALIEQCREVLTV